MDVQWLSILASKNYIQNWANSDSNSADTQLAVLQWVPECQLDLAVEMQGGLVREFEHRRRLAGTQVSGVICELKVGINSPFFISIPTQVPEQQGIHPAAQPVQHFHRLAALAVGNRARVDSHAIGVRLLRLAAPAVENLGEKRGQIVP